MKSLARLYQKWMFQTPWFGFLFNPFFIIRRKVFKQVAKHAPSLKGKMLDYGCGNKPYKELFTEVRTYIGLDIENEGHSHETEPVDVFYDGDIIPFEDATFDSFFSCQVFEHVFGLPDALKEIHRVLKPGGLGLVIVPFVWDEHEVPFDYARYAQFGLRYELELAGFEIVHHEKDSHFAQVIAQMFSLYFFQLLNTKNKFLNVVFAVFPISIINLLGITLSSIAPRVRTLFFNNTFIVKKLK